LVVSGFGKQVAVSRVKKSSKRRAPSEPAESQEPDFVETRDRLKRIESLKKAVATNSYKVSDQDLADKILNYMLRK
jgi:anti-sigma28 factor (negative regulator of flagellin synthesis)